MTDQVIVNKVAIIERCIIRIKEEYAFNPENLKNFTRQDSIILNIQRACEAAISLAMHLIAEKGWGLPQSSREAFEILRVKGVISEQLAVTLKGMVGFRNLAVHDYQSINLKIVQKIIEQHLGDLQEFAQVMLEYKQ